MSTGPGEFAKENGFLGYLHFIVFPLDLFVSGDEEFEAGREQRVTELTPILFWLMPLIVLLTATTYLNGLGLLALFLIETIALVFLSVIYCWRLSLGFLIETFVNFALSFALMAFLIYLIMYAFSSCGFVIFVIIIIAVIAYFSRGGGYYDDDYDDDW